MRSTRCIPLFHELEDSNTYHYEATEMESSSSGIGKAKQVFNDDEEGEWKQETSSAMSRFEEISNCHEHELASTAPISSRSPHFGCKQIFNKACRR
jgi:hypothetical protein